VSGKPKFSTRAVRAHRSAPNLSVQSASGQLSIYLAQPTGSGPWPGIVVVHDIFGIGEDLIRQTEWLTDAGYIVAAPNLFNQANRLTCIVRLMRDIRDRKGSAFDQVDATRRALAERRDCNGAIGILGFCIGGDLVLLLAPTGVFDVASINYGSVPPDAQSVLANSCPIVGSYGARDRRLAGAAERLRIALDANKIASDIKEYPEAGHAFMNTAGPIIRKLGRVAGAGYNSDSAADARARILRFFDQHLRAGNAG
jgi:carboxymethylenebutenolidase